MGNYVSQPQGQNNNVIKVPHYYQKSEANVIERHYGMGENIGTIPTMNSIADTYDRNERVKEILGNIFT